LFLCYTKSSGYEFFLYRRCTSIKGISSHTHLVLFVTEKRKDKEERWEERENRRDERRKRRLGYREERRGKKKGKTENRMRKEIEERR
jgi:hypothetical protein